MAKFKKKKSAPVGGKDDPRNAPPGREGKQKRDHDTSPKDPAAPAAEPVGEGEAAPPAAEENPTRAPPAAAAAGGPPPRDEPPISLAQQSEKDDKLNRLFWMRVAFAAAAGIVATLIFEPIEAAEERRWTSIGFMIIVFIATIIIGKSMRIPFSLSDRKKIVTQGIGSYVFIYLFVWILSYTLVNIGNVGSSPGATPFP